MDLEIKSTHLKSGSIDKFSIVKGDKKLEFAFFKANGIYFININNDHIIDYKQFCKVKSLKQAYFIRSSRVKIKVNIMSVISK